jgi:hypothetical protein
MMFSDKELDKALRWVVRGLNEANVDVNNIQAVVVWMLENQLPEKEAMLAEVEAEDEAERLATIEALKEEIKRLEGDAPQGVIEHV